MLDRNVSFIESERDEEDNLNLEEDSIHVPCVPVSNIYSVLGSPESTPCERKCMYCEFSNLCQEKSEENECCDCGVFKVGLFKCKDCLYYSCIRCMSE